MSNAKNAKSTLKSDFKIVDDMMLFTLPEQGAGSKEGGPKQTSTELAQVVKAKSEWQTAEKLLNLFNCESDGEARDRVSDGSQRASDSRCRGGLLWLK